MAEVEERYWVISVDVDNDECHNEVGATKAVVLARTLKSWGWAETVVNGGARYTSPLGATTDIVDTRCIDPTWRHV